jgi:hypothetical protein
MAIDSAGNSYLFYCALFGVNCTQGAVLKFSLLRVDIEPKQIPFRNDRKKSKSKNDSRGFFIASGSAKLVRDCYEA